MPLKIEHAPLDAAEFKVVVDYLLAALNSLGPKTWVLKEHYIGNLDIGTMRFERSDGIFIKVVFTTELDVFGIGSSTYRDKMRKIGEPVRLLAYFDLVNHDQIIDGFREAIGPSA
jgi:hypothetical protein